MFTHNINPVIVSFLGLEIRYYGVLIAIGFAVAYLLFTKYLKKKKFSADDIDTCAVVLMISVLIGARLFHVLFYNPSFYFSNPIEILKIWKGGIASHGGLFFAIITIFYLAKKYSKDFYFFSDPLAVGGAFYGILVRLGNFFNGELVGKISEVPWAVKFTCCEGFRHPVQIYESFSYMITFIFLIILYKRRKFRSDGIITWLFVLLFSIFRIILEFFKDKPVIFAGLTMGQLLSVPFLLLASYFVAKKVININYRKREE